MDRREPEQAGTEANRSTADTDLSWTNDDTRKKMLSIASNWAAALDSQVENIVSKIGSFVALDSKEHSAICEFVSWRAQNLEELVRERLQTHPSQV
ncbi:hypothetical protein GGE07_006076 [Sinorhizobium terangae]|nr:hypothetical protein [Sinorhizobium terangae]